MPQRVLRLVMKTKTRDLPDANNPPGDVQRLIRHPIVTAIP